MPFPGHKHYGKMGPLNKSEMDLIPMKNKDIEKLQSIFKVGPSGMPYNPKRRGETTFQTGPSGHSYNPARVREMKKRKTTA
jgi:hypothetical protein